ncbi:MAG TPA: hypothetical protein VFW09_05245 [Solirubrobacteraceae bacterium]|nr:hypothetical protein [Solirubrobacteraceae bacterium]
MIRQRINLHRPPIGEAAARLLVSALALALIWYGAMVVLAACKVSPDTINDISAYRTVFDVLSSITAADITGRDRAIVAVAGVLCLIVFAPLAWRVLPRPYLARTETELHDGDDPGRTEIAPRTFERAAEVAALRHPSVTGVAARFGAGAVDVRVQLNDGLQLPSTLRAVQERVREAASAHGLPDHMIDVTFAGVAPDSKGAPR